jgi:hypothetical protein
MDGKAAMHAGINGVHSHNEECPPAFMHTLTVLYSHSTNFGRAAPIAVIQVALPH